MNIALIGYRGSGKTTICRLIAASMNKKLVSFDDEFQKRAKLSIDKFVAKYGWEKYREAEVNVIESMSDFDDCIFDTNSSILIRNENMINLKKTSLTVFLAADAKTILERIKSSKMLNSSQKENSVDEIKRFLEQYEEKCKKSADYIIDTSKMTPEQAHDLIVHYATAELK